MFRLNRLPAARWDILIMDVRTPKVSGVDALRQIDAPGFHERLLATTQRLVTGLRTAAAEARIPFTTNHVCGMFGLFFTERGHVATFSDATACDVERFKRFFHGMLDEGIYLAPSAFEAGFVSAAHTPDEIDATVAAAARVFARL
jgi:glutamate-1-semialdehyde 2,1-aminomutase